MTDSQSSIPIRRTVLLRHTLPDGSAHNDWMLELPGDAEHRLITFRIHWRPDQIDSHGAICSRLDDHRIRYLDYEGAISVGRGSVRRLARGEILELLFSDQRLEATIRWATRTGRLRAEPIDGDRWALRWEVMDEAG